MQQIKIGTMVRADEHAAAYVAQIIPHGFECFSFTYPSGCFKGVEPQQLADAVMPVLSMANVETSNLSVFGNMLEHTEEAELTRKCFRQAIDCASLFHCSLVTGFTGRENGRSIPDNIARFKEIWTPIAEYAAEKGVRIAFENCLMGGNWHTGSWNIAINPDAWELMFEALPMDNIGLEWEPCHQMVQLIDPIPQIRTWGGKFFHIHGKDASIRRDVIAKHGFFGRETVCRHRTPGFGECNWTEVFSELRLAGYQGNVDIEGWHDPVYRDELEMTGQVFALRYLKKCRGDAFIPNPV